MTFMMYLDPSLKNLNQTFKDLEGLVIFEKNSNSDHSVPSKSFLESNFVPFASPPLLLKV